MSATVTSNSETMEKQEQQEKQQVVSNDGDPFWIEHELGSAPRPIAGQHSNIVEFYAGRNVLITGASGFIGKVLIEKLLRTCPSIGKIYVLVRPKRGKQARERVRELLDSRLFDGVRVSKLGNLDERVLVVEGDVTDLNLGLSSYNLARVTKDVSVIFHSAATVKFDEPLKQSVAINIAGVRNMINLCRRIPNLAGLVHVSTAYANCNIDQVDEHIYPVDMEPESLIQMADWLDQDTLQELKWRLLGARPNTYTYTKALAEWLLVKSARDLPIVICRPSIVVASSCEPFRGWIDNVNGPTGVILGTGKGLIRSMYAEKDFVADLVPVDKVISLIVTLGWFAHKYNQVNQEQRNKELADESDLADSLICSSSGSSSSVAGSSAASTSGDSLDDQPEHEMTSGALSLTESELCANNSTAATTTTTTTTAASRTRATTPMTSIGVHRDDGYGSRSPRYATSEASSDSSSSSSSARSTRSRRHRHLSNDSNNSGEESEQQKDQNEAKETNEGRSKVTTTTTTTTTTLIVDNCGAENDLIATSLCDIQKQKQTKKRRRSHESVQEIKAEEREPKQKQEEIPSECNTATTTTTTTTNPPSCPSTPVIFNELDEKLKQFRQKTRAKLMVKKLPDELADIPVFHCTSGSENPITWGQVQIFIVAALAVFPSLSTYRYPCGSFTNNERLDNFYRLTLHYIPGYIVDFLTRLFGGKPIIVRIFQKFDQAANVLKAFTSRQWHFAHDNRLYLMNELMSDEDRRLFDCDIKSLDWRQFCLDYVAGVRKFLLKEPMTNLEQARRNLSFVFYRNLSIQVVLFVATVYYLATSMEIIN